MHVYIQKPGSSNSIFSQLLVSNYFTTSVITFTTTNLRVCLVRPKKITLPEMTHCRQQEMNNYNATKIWQDYQWDVSSIFRIIQFASLLNEQHVMKKIICLPLSSIKDDL